MDPTLKNALAQSAVVLFGAVNIQLPSYDLRLLDGAAVVVAEGLTYAGLDPAFGSIADLSELSEETGDAAPEITVTLNPPDLAASAALANPLNQGSTIRVLAGAVDPVTGLTIGQPETLFLGEIDVPTINVDQSGARTVEITAVSVFERLFEVEEGQRASNGWHQSIWPGEKGLEFMTGTNVNLYWGVKPPKSSDLSKGGSLWSPNSANVSVA
ncbi:hypothetical protein [Novosphingobium sp. YAF33]|uniref:hypothetical protein n=1 Tax=Novosphingobium sp. YAF33 TaxID=3233082 RepID=UPI003F955436